MCGICGYAFADRDRQADPDRLLVMRDRINHRGPDGVGSRVEGAVALGHTRLSIIDLAGGAQPLSNEDGTVWVTFNGEIYNHEALRRELVGRGHRFQTHSDTEVLVHGYEEWGDGLPTRLNGMFAFAIHDRTRDRVLIARDHLGIKPLFYARTSEGLFFGSEIKTVLAGARMPARALPERVTEYLAFRYIAGRNTLYDGVFRLLPGHLLVWEHGRMREGPFWTPFDAAPTHRPSMAEAADELGALLDASVRSQMMSEVPLGAFCSGGVDSGLVTGYAAKAAAHRFHTFSVGFADPRWDESALARDTAQRFGTEHHTITADPAQIAALLPQLVWHHDEPLSHPNAVPLFQLSRFARERVTVVLTGEGSDELLAGYPRYHIARIRSALRFLPASGRTLVAALLDRSGNHRARKAGAALRWTPEDAYIYNSLYVDPAIVERLTGIAVADVIGERRRLLRQAIVEGDPVSTMSRYELLTYLGCALDRMDRMSMATGLEGRVPFLDVPLVEWGIRLHPALKVEGKRTKAVAKVLGERTLSDRITKGAKSGFGLPLDEWFRSEVFGDLVRRMGLPGQPAHATIRPEALATVLEEHRTGRAEHGEALWHLANLHLWYEGNAPGATRAPVARGGRLVEEPVAG